MGYRPIREYGVVGNDDRIALVDSSGSVDWCCFPHVAGPSVFGRLLDDERGGHFAVTPTDTFESDRQYRGHTNVLETTFQTAAGRATLTDFMPAGGDGRHPDHQRALFRRVRCEAGRLTVQIDFAPRLAYAQAETTVRRADGTVVAEGDGDELTLQVRGPADLAVSDGRAHGTPTLEAGETVWLVVQHDHVEPTPSATCREILAETLDYWHDWAEGVVETADAIVGDEPWREAVIRSALVCKLLINEGSGAIYGAATTSLPEAYGGSRNWDYRYNWIRDAKFTVQALANLGTDEEVRDYFEWFREIVHEDPEDVQPVYGVHGERDLPERHLEHLSGYRYATPVRVGNAAVSQRQIDVYGTIVQGIHETADANGAIEADDWDSIRRLIDHVCEVWDERDRGIWEYRDAPRHYVHSKLMCWVALDRGLDLAETRGLDAPVERWRDERATVREAIEDRGYSDSADSFVQHFGTDETIDATCLLLALYEFLPPDDPRIERTVDAVQERLLADDGLVNRASGPDVPDEGRGAFLLCSFWLVDALVLCGRVDEARAAFTDVLSHVSPPTLLSERIDTATGEFLGNYPQAYSHIGLINSAIYLGSATGCGSLETDPLADPDGT